MVSYRTDRDIITARMPLSPLLFSYNVSQQGCRRYYPLANSFGLSERLGVEKREGCTRQNGVVERIKRPDGGLPSSPPHLPFRHRDKPENEGESQHLSIVADGNFSSVLYSPEG
ncbi:hypothetical protein EJP617_17620 [Erwinia sp. Ejp617]|nr:hypothetical protein [Erwinia sp. Ejp617]ADP11443.1 hypothetical protein EJP617_17620 [Erwinia sp. Ejp617]